MRRKIKTILKYCKTDLFRDLKIVLDTIKPMFDGLIPIHSTTTIKLNGKTRWESTLQRNVTFGWMIGSDFCSNELICLFGWTSIDCVDSSCRIGLFGRCCILWFSSLSFAYFCFSIKLYFLACSISSMSISCLSFASSNGFLNRSTCRF